MPGLSSAKAVSICVSSTLVIWNVKYVVFVMPRDRGYSARVILTTFPAKIPITFHRTGQSRRMNMVTAWLQRDSRKPSLL